MPTTSLDELSQAQKERLRFIDFRLYFFSTLNRNDLIKRFGIKEAAATRDITTYRDLVPDNCDYTPNAKSYLKLKTFKPLFSYKAREVLNTFASGIGDDSVLEPHTLLPCETPIALTNPDLNILATLANAIVLKRIVKATYHSLKSGDSEREIVPFTFVNNGLRWHLRGWDRKRERFGDFVLTRFSKAEIIDGAPETHEQKDADIQWNRIVELDLVPHPDREFKKAIELDYKMVDGVFKVQIRAAVAGYLLRLWNVDCSKDHSLEGAEYHLWLKNTLALYGVNNLAIAPGFQEESLS